MSRYEAGMLHTINDIEILAAMRTTHETQSIATFRLRQWVGIGALGPWAFGLVTFRVGLMILPPRVLSWNLAAAMPHPYLLM